MMNISRTITSQYLAALEMLKQTISKCPESLWNRPEDRTKFWHIAFHVLFYTHFYLQEKEESFMPWIKHRREYVSLGNDPQSPEAQQQLIEPYTKDDLLEYLAFCQHEVAQRVPKLDLEATTGFYWLPFDKLELQIYSIRHLQQHTGELMERLGSSANVEIEWVGMKQP